ncbi:hypothetical protein PMAYCL1PPCAC_26893, partial [Pristionchus mayeri]
RNFDNTINSISKRAGIVDGLFGKNLDLMGKLVFELGSAVNTDFAGTWGEQIGQNSNLIQQACAFEACKDLQKCLGLIVDIHRFKNYQYLPTIQSRTVETSKSGVENVLQPRIGITFEIKENPVGIEEPIDSFAEIEQEE